MGTGTGKQTDADRAHVAVRRAVKSGVLVRPSACQMCGITPPRRRDGRSGLQAHHESYTAPLNVVWLCPCCHRRCNPEQSVGRRNGAYTSVHTRPRGEQHGRAKLTYADVAEIRQLSREGYGTFQIGRRFGINHKTIRQIIKREIWRTAA